MVKKILAKLYIALVFMFLYAPIVVLIIYSFNNSKSRGQWGGFTLKWYAELINDPEILMSVYYTLLIAVLTAIISTIIGTIGAIGIYKMDFRIKQIILNLNYLPILNPDIVIAVSLLALYRFVGLDFGIITILLAHVTFCTPYVVLSILPKLKQLNQNLLEAAVDLGATPLYAFRKVIIPEIMPGIITGALISFTLSVDDFVISFFTAGHGIQTISITVWSMARRGINPVINAMSTIMFVVLLVLLLLINRRSDNAIGRSK